MGLRNPRDILHNRQRLSDILDAPAKYVRGEAGGVRADLAGAKLVQDLTLDVTL